MATPTSRTKSARANPSSQVTAPKPKAAAKTAAKSASNAIDTVKGWAAGAKAAAKKGVSGIGDAAFPDMKNDGKVVNVKTGTVSDFSLDALQKSTYYPKGSEGRMPMVFTEGANQWREVGASRAKQHADLMGFPMAIVHNASFVQEKPGQNKLATNVNRQIEGLSVIGIAKNLISEKSVKNLSQAMMQAVESGKPACFAGESQGSALLGQALKATRDAYVAKHAASGSAKDKAAATKAFEEKAGKSLYAMTFGNTYKDYPKGPNYLHVYMKGDPAPQQLGSRPDNRPADAKTQYITFDQLFPGKDNFENHNIAVAMPLLKRTAELNNVNPGDLPGLFAASQKAFQNGTSLKTPTLDDVKWPAGMQEKLWDKKQVFSHSMSEYKAQLRK
jgi:hypothetical protein